MSKLTSLIILIVLSTSLSARLKPEFVPGELIIQVESPSLFSRLFSKDTPLEDIAAKYNGTLKEVYLKTPKTGIQALSFSDKSTYTLNVPLTEDLDLIASELHLNDSVTLVQKNQIFTLFDLPNDPHLGAPNISEGNQPYISLLNIDDAWDITQGDPEIVVAVIDSGVAYNHPDLANQIWSNPLISSGHDADGNDQHNDIRGWDFGSSDEGDNNPFDNLGHGTQVAGLVSAHTNNGDGIAGVGYNLSIMPIKVSDSSGEINTVPLVNAINYAVEKEVDIINLSLGGALEGESNALLSNAVESAIDAGIIVVASAGNVPISGIPYNIDEAGIVPATYPDVIAVSATDLSGDFATSVSLYGESVDFAAPGQDIYTTTHIVSSETNTYDTNNGTSFSAPIVSGIIGLMLSHEPDATLSQVFLALQDSALDKGDPGHDIFYGHGLVDAHGALDTLRSGPKISLSNDLSDFFSTASDFEISFTDAQEVATDTVRVTINYGTSSVELSPTSAGVTFIDGIFTIALSLLFDIPAGSRVTVEAYAEDTEGESTLASRTYQQESSFLLFGPGGVGSSILNAPNPFAPQLESTSFTFEITQPAVVDIDVYSLNLEKVRDVYSGSLSAGYHDSITWDGRDESGDIVPNGVYVFVLTAESNGKRYVKRNRIAVLAR